MTAEEQFYKKYNDWRKDWNKFCYEALNVRLDNEQRAIIESVQFNPRTSVASGTSRGKDYVSACACLCFMYLTPVIGADGKMIKNTKVAMTAPTDRQIKNIMIPEIHRLWKSNPFLSGRLVGYDIRTDYSEWYLTGFKADSNSTEAWSGFHASNVMFAVTEATGIPDKVFEAIEGNLQNNSRLLLVFNPNVTTGYASSSMKSERFKKFRLNSLNAENVVKKRIVFQGQVDYEWVKDKVEHWCYPVAEDDFDESEGDFRWENRLYKPNDLFRVKVLGMFPKVSEDVLIPYEWIEIANRRWTERFPTWKKDWKANVLIGADVAGMGRDSSVKCTRIGNVVTDFYARQSLGKADHMAFAGVLANDLRDRRTYAFIDTIGEGAGVFSRLLELGFDNAISCKYSESARGLSDITGQRTFANMRSYCYWSMRDWLNPKNGFEPMLPPNDQIMEEATNTKWKFRSDGSIIIEPKEEIKKRIHRSPDALDALANTFYPYFDGVSDEELMKDFL